MPSVHVEHTLALTSSGEIVTRDPDLAEISAVAVSRWRFRGGGFAVRFRASPGYPCGVVSVIME